MRLRVMFCGVQVSGVAIFCYGHTFLSETGREAYGFGNREMFASMQLCV